MRNVLKPLVKKIRGNSKIIINELAIKFQHLKVFAFKNFSKHQFLTRL